LKKASDHGNGMINAGLIHIEVSDPTQADQPRDPHAMLLEKIGQRRPSAMMNVHEDDVGLGRSHGQTLDVPQSQSQALRQGVVLRTACARSPC